MYATDEPLSDLQSEHDDTVDRSAEKKAEHLMYAAEQPQISQAPIAGYQDDHDNVCGLMNDDDDSSGNHVTQHWDVRLQHSSKRRMTGLLTGIAEAANRRQSLQVFEVGDSEEERERRRQQKSSSSGRSKVSSGGRNFGESRSTRQLPRAASLTDMYLRKQ